MSNPAVRCEGLSVAYGELTAVDQVTFEVQPGEVFGLLGPNGAGKTSVVRALTTILDPSDGRAEVAGVSLSNPARLRGRIGVLPESNGYPGAETAFSYLRFYGQLFGLPSAESAQRAGSLLRRFGLGDNTHQSISTFSRGMRQRLGIARSLINDPQVLFLDEPTLGLDPAGREDILSHLTSEVARKGAAVVLCSHLLDDVERVCDRVAILDCGRIVAAGMVHEVIESAGVGGTMRLTVEQIAVSPTVTYLQSLPQVVRAAANPSRAGLIEMELAEPEPHANQILSLLLGKGVEVRGIELQGARLSEAFLKLTQGETGQ
jgi:ABC-2 type transport system ATP-binding protein